MAKVANRPKKPLDLEMERIGRSCPPVSDPYRISLRHKMSRQYIASTNLICLEYFTGAEDENGLPVIRMGVIDDIEARAPKIVEQWMASQFYAPKLLPPNKKRRQNLADDPQTSLGCFLPRKPYFLYPRKSFTREEWWYDPNGS